MQNNDLANFFTWLKDIGVMTNTEISGFAAEALLDSRNCIDISLLNSMFRQEFTFSKVESVFKSVFGTHLPRKWKMTHTDSIVKISRQDFLSVYEPAKYANTKQWIFHVYQKHGALLVKQDLFNWVLSTEKPKVLLGDLYVE